MAPWLPLAQSVKNPPAIQGTACTAGVMGLNPGSGRSPRVGNGNPLQYSCLENSRREEPGGLQSVVSQRVGLDSATKHTHAHANLDQMHH